MFKFNDKNTRTTLFTFWCFYCYLWTYFTSFSSVSIVDFEQLNISWVGVSDFNNNCHNHDISECVESDTLRYVTHSAFYLLQAWCIPNCFHFPCSFTWNKSTQQAFTFSKSIIEILEKGVKCVENKQIVLVSLLLTLNKF